MLYKKTCTFQLFTLQSLHTPETGPNWKSTIVRPPSNKKERPAVPFRPTPSAAFASRLFALFAMARTRSYNHKERAPTSQLVRAAPGDAAYAPLCQLLHTTGTKARLWLCMVMELQTTLDFLLRRFAFGVPLSMSPVCRRLSFLRSDHRPERLHIARLSAGKEGFKLKLSSSVIFCCQVG